MAEHIRDSLGHAEDWNLDSLDIMSLDIVTQKFFGEANDAQRGIVDLWLPFLGANGNPDLSRHLVGDAVKRERRDEADDPLGYSFCRFG